MVINNTFFIEVILGLFVCSILYFEYRVCRQILFGITENILVRFFVLLFGYSAVAAVTAVLLLKTILEFWTETQPGFIPQGFGAAGIIGLIYFITYEYNRGKQSIKRTNVSSKWEGHVLKKNKRRN